ncbi:hypothetical protein GCM10010275_37670 [Streptomyces litmocidini]|uniref:hypothetical protein n=1 Tax=Streptomyces litmocidini TaxID=67318 RepID=UPI0019BD5593|nr:hypothetical protein [Streptomyces litmocidini]GGU96265.1 hypothetical protein GCM10010275_37670 [Streptomyces litmocidini]
MPQKAASGVPPSAVSAAPWSEVFATADRLRRPSRVEKAYAQVLDARVGVDVRGIAQLQRLEDAVLVRLGHRPARELLDERADDHECRRVPEAPATGDEFRTARFRPDHDPVPVVVRPDRGPPR